MNSNKHLIINCAFINNIGKFLIKEKKLSDEYVCEYSSSKCGSAASLSSARVSQTMYLSGMVHEDQDSYLKFEIICSGPENQPVLECLICSKKLRNENMVSSKLKRHLTTKHNQIVGKDENYFKCLLSLVVKQALCMEKKIAEVGETQIARYKVI